MLVDQNTVKKKVKRLMITMRRNLTALRYVVIVTNCQIESRENNKKTKENFN